MNEMSILQKMLIQLASPYKKTEAYEVFSEVKSNEICGSCFWKTNVGYVVKYENAKPINQH